MEKVIIDSGLVKFLLQLHHNTNKNNNNGYLIWSHELAHVLSLDQIGVSACGPTAVYNVLSALAGRSIFALNDADADDNKKSDEEIEEQNDQIPLIDPQTLLQLLPARLRNYEAPLVEYLISRIKAGTIHQDLIDGITGISENKVSGFFFQFPANISEKELYDWFIHWLKRDTVPVATENLMVLGNDAWHHQMIYGVERIPKSKFRALANNDSNITEDYLYKVYATNPMEPISMNILKETITSEPFMQIPTSHVSERYSPDQRKMKFQLLEDELFKDTAVLDQIKGIFASECPDDPQYANAVPNNSPYIYLPWGGLAGVTLFCKTNSLAFDQLTEYKAKHSTNVYLPAYKKSVVVCKYSKMNDPIS